MAGEASHSSKIGPAIASTAGLVAPQDDRDSNGEHRREPHGAHRAGEVAAGQMLPFTGGVSRGIPFQQPFVGEQQTDDGAQDRVQAVNRLMGQGCQRKAGLQQAFAGRLCCGGKMRAQPRIARLAQQVQQRRRQRGNHQDAKHRQGPEPGGGTRRPAEQQQQRQCGRH
jgi:hypothetical protein